MSYSTPDDKFEEIVRQTERAISVGKILAYDAVSITVSAYGLTLDEDTIEALVDRLKDIHPLKFVGLKGEPTSEYNFFFNSQPDAITLSVWGQ